MTSPPMSTLGLTADWMFEWPPRYDITYGTAIYLYRTLYSLYLLVRNTEDHQIYLQ